MHHCKRLRELQPSSFQIRRNSVDLYPACYSSHSVIGVINPDNAEAIVFESDVFANIDVQGMCIRIGLEGNNVHIETDEGINKESKYQRRKTENSGKKNFEKILQSSQN